VKTLQRTSGLLTGRVHIETSALGLGSLRFPCAKPESVRKLGNLKTAIQESLSCYGGPGPQEIRVQCLEGQGSRSLEPPSRLHVNAPGSTNYKSSSGNAVQGFCNQPQSRAGQTGGCGHSGLGSKVLGEPCRLCQLSSVGRPACLKQMGITEPGPDGYGKSHQCPSESSLL
jgi:hypothetical protein